MYLTCIYINNNLTTSFQQCSLTQFTKESGDVKYDLGCLTTSVGCMVLLDIYILIFALLQSSQKSPMNVNILYNPFSGCQEFDSTFFWKCWEFCASFRKKKWGKPTCLDIFLDRNSSYIITILRCICNISFKERERIAYKSCKKSFLFLNWNFFILICNTVKGCRDRAVKSINHEKCFKCCSTDLCNNAGCGETSKSNYTFV